MLRTAIAFLLVSSALLAAGATAKAASPELISYQALLVDVDGDPIDGIFDLTFTIYDSESGGAVVWQEEHSAVEVSNGQVSLLLGSGTPAVPIGSDVFDASERWLGVKVGDQPELAPRQRLVTVPYTHRVSTIDDAKAGRITGILNIEPLADAFATDSTSGLILVGESADSVVIIPGLGEAIRVTDPNGESAAAIEVNPQGGSLLITATDVAKEGLAAERTVTIDPGSGIVLESQEASGETQISLRAEPTGGVIQITATDVAKDDLASGHKVVLDPANGIALGSIDGFGDTTLTLANTETGGQIRITATDVAKGTNATFSSVLINEQGLFIFGETEDDTTLQLLTDGNIVSDGQILTGENGSNNGVWAVSLGYSNAATGDTSAIVGGSGNLADVVLAAIGGGSSNTAHGLASVIGGGLSNYTDSEASTVGGGSGNAAFGAFSVVPGGSNNAARGDYSFAAGNNARANHASSVVIAATSPVSAPDSVTSGGAGQMVLSASGNLYITNDGEEAPYNTSRLINTSTGAYLSNGGTWVNASDANLKENFRDVSEEELLAAISQLRITEWNYKNEDERVRHIGPTAQDFHEAFGVGSDNESISTIDPAGIALAAIKELERRTRRIGELEKKVERLESLQSEIEELKALIKQQSSSNR